MITGSKYPDVIPLQSVFHDMYLLEADRPVPVFGTGICDCRQNRLNRASSQARSTAAMLSLPRSPLQQDFQSPSSHELLKVGASTQENR